MALDLFVQLLGEVIDIAIPYKVHKVFEVYIENYACIKRGLSSLA